ncbi:MAG: NADH-quinone oxidoreductase subunit A [Chloroflexi bacterium]|nr:NADH-quinone oxidoreductase subunit A [Ktedonobacteraceae bacterium]MBV9020979.1 NADH-quinone oxidoreductase subunit A [Ktedonobacteraceae bacterium]MBV9706035.1 NADH-quinone oxidoreductase subunit A [Chloroflexota bacterium]
MQQPFSGSIPCIPTWKEKLVSTPSIGYLYAAILLAAGFVFVIIATSLANLLAPHDRTKEKLQTYESGETPIGSARVQYPLGFYIFALLFVAFDVDIVFIIAWAIIFKQLSLFGFFEIFFFIVVLVLGLVYAWRKGVTRWI